MLSKNSLNIGKKLFSKSDSELFICSNMISHSLKDIFYFSKLAIYRVQAQCLELGMFKSPYFFTIEIQKRYE